MRAPRPALALLLLLIPTKAPVAAPEPAAEPRLIRAHLDDRVTAETLLRAGLDVVQLHRGSHAVLLEWPGDGAKLTAMGARTSVIDPAPGRTAAEATRIERSRTPRAPARRVRSAVDPDGRYRLETLPAEGDGSLGGFWNLDEVKMKLDDLVAGDLNDVVADKLDTIGVSLGPHASYPGRPIWGLTLARRVVGPDARPLIFYSGLTHAREPAGMQSVLHFAEHLLSRYGSDPEATYLLDHRRIYIVPVVNPDGYKLNENQYIASGNNFFGMHRKNLRDTNGNGVLDNGTDGVDLNRNFGYLWGLNDIGSSGDPASGNYRGTAPFSEPEAQAVRDAVVALQPRVALDFHAFGDLMLYPWSYTSEASPDSAAFVEWSDEMTAGSGYLAGNGPHVTYETNGDFTDWAYGDVVLKPRVLPWTPEVGGPSDFFWPPPSRIVPIAEENLRACIHAAYIAGALVRVEEQRLAEGVLNAGGVAHLEVRARNQGFGDAAGPGLVATLSSLTAGAQVLANSGALPTLGPRQTATEWVSFVVAADDTVTPGRMLRFRVDFTTSDGYFSRDTIEVPCGTPTLLVADDAANLSQWSGRWVIEPSDPTRPGPHFSDYVGAYKPNSRRELNLTPSLDLSSGVHAYAMFVTRWEIESNYDCALLEASLDGANWTPLRGTGTTLGTNGEQPIGAPIYQGTRGIWRPERSDLSGFSGPGATAVRLRWRLLSDTGGQFDGYHFDSLRVVIFDPAAQPGPVAVGETKSPTVVLDSPAPQPARDALRFGFALPAASTVQLEVFDLQGRRVRRLASGWRPAGRFEGGWDLRDDAGNSVATGVYALRLATETDLRSRRLIVVR